jgi:beta-glucanase (GH16 family)
MGRSPGRDFHVYSVAWEPGRIRWYVDDRMYHTVTPADLGGRAWVFDHDFFLLLNSPSAGSHETAGSRVTPASATSSSAPAAARDAAAIVVS